MNKVAVIGAGAWGTALACAAQRAGNDVLLQAHEAEVAETINRLIAEKKIYNKKTTE